MTETDTEHKMKKGGGIIHHMLQRMSVDGDDSDGSSPLMVLFVEMLVEAWVVEQPERKEEEDQNKNQSVIYW